GVLERVGPDLVQQADAAALLAEVDEHAAPLGGYGLQRGVALEAAVAPQGVEGVAGEALGVHAHEHRFVRGDVAHRQHDVLVAPDLVDVAVDRELAELGGQRGRGDALDEALALQAVGDEVGDGPDLQAVPRGELADRGQAHHGAVVVHQLRYGRRGPEAGQAAEVHSGLGVARAPQHAALARAQREDVPGPRQVLGPGVL